MGKRSSLWIAQASTILSFVDMTEYYLLLANERAPQHADTLANHRDLQVMLLLEPVNNVLKGRVAVEGEAIPKRPLSVAVLVLRGRYGLREAKERQCQVDEAVLVVFAVRLVVDELEENGQDGT